MRQSEGPFADPLAYEEEVLDIRTLRLRAHMTQAQLAVRFGVDIKTITNWETGRHIPKLPRRPEMLDGLAEIFGFGGETGDARTLPYITPSSLKTRQSQPAAVRKGRAQGIRRWSAAEPTAGNSSSGDNAVNQVAIQLARLIEARVVASSASLTRTASLRTAPCNLTEMLADLLRVDPLTCGLCGSCMEIRPGNHLLQPSADRIDSSIADYGSGNLHLVHLGCNLGKSDASMEDYREWLGIVRQAGVPVEYRLGS